MMLIHCTKLTCIYELLLSQVVTTLKFWTDYGKNISYFYGTLHDWLIDV